MPDNLPDLIEDATLAFHGDSYDAFRAAAARLAMPLIAAYEALQTAMEHSHAERDKLAAELATTKADLANERAVRAVQAGKLAHAARLVPKPHTMFGFDDPDAPDEFKSWIDSSYAFWGIERPTEGGA